MIFVNGLFAVVYFIVFVFWNEINESTIPPIRRLGSNSTLQSYVYETKRRGQWPKKRRQKCSELQSPKRITSPSWRVEWAQRICQATPLSLSLTITPKTTVWPYCIRRAINILPYFTLRTNERGADGIGKKAGKAISLHESSLAAPADVTHPSYSTLLLASTAKCLGGLFNGWEWALLFVFYRDTNTLVLWDHRILAVEEERGSVVKLSIHGAAPQSPAEADRVGEVLSTISYLWIIFTIAQHSSPPLHCPRKSFVNSSSWKRVLV